MQTYRGRHTSLQTDIEATDLHTHTNTHRPAEVGTQGYRQTHRPIDRHTGHTEVGIQSYRQTCRPTDRHTGHTEGGTQATHK